MVLDSKMFHPPYSMKRKKKKKIALKVLNAFVNLVTVALMGENLKIMGNKILLQNSGFGVLSKRENPCC